MKKNRSILPEVPLTLPELISQYTVFIKFRNMNDKIVSTGNTFYFIVKWVNADILFLSFTIGLMLITKVLIFFLILSFS